MVLHSPQFATIVNSHCPFHSTAMQFRREENRMRPNYRRSRIFYLFVSLLLLIVLLLAYLGLRSLEKQAEKPTSRGDHRQRFAYDSLLELEGGSYRLRKNLSLVLIMGIDQPKESLSLGFRNGGQADFLRLLIVDHSKREFSQLAIDRDTMTPISILGVLGKDVGKKVAQISLSHGFGDGKEQSNAFTVAALSELLLNTPIDHYIALHMDGIVALNDSLGGVEVELVEDFSSLDPSMTAGSILSLQGKQAEIFVRGRMQVGDGSNVGRMRRQEQYVSALAKKMKAEQKKDRDFVGKLFDKMGEYLQSDMGRGQLINLSWNLSQYKSLPVRYLAGEHSLGRDGYVQFRVDKEALQETLLELCYEKVK